MIFVNNKITAERNIYDNIYDHNYSKRTWVGWPKGCFSDNFDQYL